MSGRKSKKANKSGGSPWYEAAWLTGLLLVAVAVYVGLALTGDPGPWWGVLNGQGLSDLLAVENPGGPVGSVINLALNFVFGGLWCWTVPLLTVIVGFGLLFGRLGNLRPWIRSGCP